jgi:hypothetical protein
MGPGLEKSFPEPGETPHGPENSFPKLAESPLPSKNSFPEPPDIPLGAEDYWLWNGEVDAGLEKRPFRVQDAAFVVIWFFGSSRKAMQMLMAPVFKPEA